MTEDSFSEVKRKQVPLSTNLILSGITTVAGFINGTVIVLVLGRLLPVAVFGEVIYSLTFANLILLIPSYGFSLMVVRDIAQQRLSPPKAIVNILAAQVLLAIVTTIGLSIFVAVSQMSANISLAIFIFFVSGLLNAFSIVISAVNKGMNNFTVEAKITIIYSLLLCVFILITFLLFPHTSITIAWCMLVSNVVEFGAALLLVRPLLRREPGLLPNYTIIRKLLRTGLPFAVQIIFATLYFQLDTLIVGKLLDMEAVGLYQAATRIVMAALPVAMIIQNSFYPRLARDYNPEIGTFKSSDPNKMIGALFLLGISGMLFFVIWAQPIISIAYGPKMLSSVPVLRVFALVLLFRFIAGGYAILLIASQRQAVLLWGAIVATFVNVILNLFWVPQYGIIGSAWGNVITNLLIMLIYLIVFYGKSSAWLAYVLSS